MADITIRPLRALADMQQAVELQRVYWGDDAESVVPAHMLFSLAAHGGHVLAAFDGDRIVGALIGFLGTSEDNPTRPAMANLQIFSKRMVVHPDYRSHGIGYRLKLAQRDFAVQQGIRLVTWTFDPLLAPNAHLNVRKLGVLCQKYWVDYYGTAGSGGLAAGGSSDRLLAEWWVTGRRIEVRLEGKRSLLTLRHYLDANTTLVNPTQLDADGLTQPGDLVAAASGSLALLEIPLDFSALPARAPALAERWRLHTRDLFLRLFGAGYVVTDFLREPHEGRERAFYVLSYNGGGVETFSSN